MGLTVLERLQDIAYLKNIEVGRYALPEKVRGLYYEVEYENTELDLLTIFQLYDERKVITLKEDKTTSKTEKKKSRRKPGPSSYGARDPKVLSSKLTSGAIATHIKYGEGTVLKNDGTTVSIRFKGSGKVRKFAIKIAAEQGLIKV